MSYILNVGYNLNYKSCITSESSFLDASTPVIIHILVVVFGVVVCVFRYISYGSHCCLTAKSINHLFFAIFFFASNIWGTNKLIDWIIKHNLDAIIYLWRFIPIIPLDIILKLNILVVKIIIFGFIHCFSSSIKHRSNLGSVCVIHIAFITHFNWSEVILFIYILPQQGIEHLIG